MFGRIGRDNVSRHSLFKRLVNDCVIALNRFRGQRRVPLRERIVKRLQLDIGKRGQIRAADSGLYPAFDFGFVACERHGLQVPAIGAKPNVEPLRESVALRFDIGVSVNVRQNRGEFPSAFFLRVGVDAGPLCLSYSNPENSC